LPPRSKGFTHGTAENAVPYLIVQLKPDWHADFAANELVSGRKRVALAEITRADVSLQPHIPALAGRSPRLLSPSDRELLRFVQVRVSSKQAANKLAKQLAQHEAIEHVSIAPAVSLPSS
jgi:hypothetical protein